MNLSICNVALLLALSFIGMIRSCEGTSNGGTVNVNEDRLPGDLVPIHYDLFLQPNIYAPPGVKPPLTFEGHVVITFECRKPTSTIVLNRRVWLPLEDSLNVTVVKPANETDPVWIMWGLDEELEFLTIILDRDLTVGTKYKVELGFTGDLQAGGGFSYKTYEEQGQTKYQSSTFFEPSMARSAFPCFDEPALKATIKVGIRRHISMKSVTNTHLESRDVEEDSYVVDRYAASPIMSMYTFCVVVGQFMCTGTTTKYGTEINVCARPEKLGETYFAIRIAALTLEWYEDYTGIRFPLRKLDHYAMIGGGGAMEHWGLVTYGENSLLVNEKTATTRKRQHVASIMAHETAHMWWGNLVTCNWWTDTWLQEGIVTYFQWKPLMPIFNVSTCELQRAFSVERALLADSSNTAWPVRPAHVNATQTLAFRVFNTFTYQKGAAIVRSLRYILGEASFRRAIQRYTKKYAYAAAVTDQLWAEFNKQAEEDGIVDTDGSKLDFKVKMDPWIKQMGFPLVNIDRSTPGQANVTQKYFLDPPDQKPVPSPYNYQWNIPLTFTSDGERWHVNGTRHWVKERQEIITRGIPTDKNKWFLANLEQSSFCRVQYDEHSRQIIVNQLIKNHTVFNILNRAQLIFDAFVICRAHNVVETVAFDMTKYLTAETEFTPFWAANDALNLPHRLLRKYSTFSVFQRYVRKISEPAYKHVGWTVSKEDPHLAKYLRPFIVSAVCSYGNAGCLTEGSKHFTKWVTDENSAHPDMLGNIMCTGVSLGDTVEWNLVFSRYKSLTNFERKSDYLMSLACSRNIWTLQRYLYKALDPKEIPSTDKRSALGYIATSHLGAALIWDYLQINWTNPLIKNEKFTLLRHVSKQFTTEEDNVLWQNFVKRYPPHDKPEEIVYNEVTATVKKNRAWLTLNKDKLQVWLEREAPPGVGGSSSGLSSMRVLFQQRHLQEQQEIFGKGVPVSFM